MSRPTTLASMLLLSTAICSPAFAQTAPSASTPAAPAASAGAGDVSEPEAPPQASAAGQEVEVSAPGASYDGGDIVVMGRNIPNPVRATPEVVSLLSAEDIARTGDGDIAGALQRVTGLSVVGNGFVYVRGLGDRYSLALLNGLALPSPEPLRRTVPLDIFPTNVVSSALVQKSYSVNYPGEFGGGVINLTTNALPEESYLEIGGSIGADTFTTSNLGYTYYGSDLDWSGFDDGSRDPAPVFRRALDSGKAILSSNFTDDELASITMSLLNAETSVVQRNDHIPGNGSLELTGGTSFDIGGTRFGVVATAGYSNTWRTRDARQQRGFSNAIIEDFRSVRTENRIIANALLGFGMEFGEHKLRFTNLYIRDTSKLARLESGYSVNIREPVEGLPDPTLRQNTNWIERSLFNSQFVGEFEFGPLSVDTRLGYANSQRESPYERDFEYIHAGYTSASYVDDYVNFLGGTTSGNASVTFSDLDEDVYNAGIDFGYELNTALPITISAGYAYLDTSRYSERRRFEFDADSALPVMVAQERPDYLLSDYNVQTYGIYLEENALLGQSAYQADLTVHAGYGQLGVELPDDNMELQIGVRYEDGDQSVAIPDILGQGDIPSPTGLKRDYWLPAGTLTWNFAEDMQLRLHASKTLARPQFRELANQLYFDVETDRSFVGNRFLVDSELFNAEARWEWYFDRDQRLTVAGFFKQIEKPIEAISGSFGSGGAPGELVTFGNAPDAILYGAEFELVKYFPLDTLADGGFLSTRRAVVIANYTFSQSELRVGEGDTVLIDNSGESAVVRPASDFFIDGAPLTGQSDHLANLQIGLEDTDRLSQQTLLLTYASERVSQRGAIISGARIPDIVEKPGLRLDFVWREGFWLGDDEIEVKFEARNITGQDYEEVQEGELTLLTNAYEVGTSFSLGATFKF